MNFIRWFLIFVFHKQQWVLLWKFNVFWKSYNNYLMVLKRCFYWRTKKKSRDNWIQRTTSSHFDSCILLPVNSKQNRWLPVFQSKQNWKYSEIKRICSRWKSRYIYIFTTALSILSYLWHKYCILYNNEWVEIG